MKKFCEIAKDDIHLAGDKISLPDIVGKSIVVTGYKITKSKFKEDNYLAIQYDLEGEQHVTFTGATVLIEQLKKYGEQIPFETTIKRLGKFYSFT
jgi:hypothetical protein